MIVLKLLEAMQFTHEGAVVVRPIGGFIVQVVAVSLIVTVIRIGHTVELSDTVQLSLGLRLAPRVGSCLWPWEQSKALVKMAGYVIGPARRR